MTEEQLMKLLREELQRSAPDGITLHVVDGMIERARDCWYVGVRPSREPSNPYSVYEVLAEVEETLAEREHVEVLFRLIDPVAPEGAGTDLPIEAKVPVES